MLYSQKKPLGLLYTSLASSLLSSPLPFPHPSLYSSSSSRVQAAVASSGQEAKRNNENSFGFNTFSSFFFNFSFCAAASASLSSTRYVCVCVCVQEERHDKEWVDSTKYIHRLAVDLCPMKRCAMIMKLRIHSQSEHIRSKPHFNEGCPAQQAIEFIRNLRILQHYKSLQYKKDFVIEKSDYRLKKTSLQEERILKQLNLMGN